MKHHPAAKRRAEKKRAASGAASLAPPPLAASGAEDDDFRDTNSNASLLEAWMKYREDHPTRVLGINAEALNDDRPAVKTYQKPWAVYTQYKALGTGAGT